MPQQLLRLPPRLWILIQAVADEALEELRVGRADGRNLGIDKVFFDFVWLGGLNFEKWRLTGG
jgi:hypothetical protein